MTILDKALFKFQYERFRYGDYGFEIRQDLITKNIADIYHHLWAIMPYSKFEEVAITLKKLYKTLHRHKSTKPEKFKVAMNYFDPCSNSDPDFASKGMAHVREILRKLVRYLQASSSEQPSEESLEQKNESNRQRRYEQIAYSCIRSISKALELQDDFLKKVNRGSPQLIQEKQTNSLPLRRSTTGLRSAGFYELDG
jgi:hypothetical protein